MVYLASYSRSVVNLFCVLSQILFCLFVCFNLYRYAKSLKGSFLTTFSALAIPWSWYCVFPCWKGRKLIVSVNIKYAFLGYLTAPRSSYFRQQFSELHKHYTAYRITCCTHFELAREKGLLIELNCNCCSVQLVRPVNIPRANHRNVSRHLGRGVGSTLKRSCRGLWNMSRQHTEHSLRSKRRKG